MSSQEESGPVRVGRFEWERLMLMSVPHPQNLKLLPIGIFMSADGGRARPGNGGLALFGPHEKTWAKLLRWAVAEGWLALVERGGARRGPNGTTIVRASVYAASVPAVVWERRGDILGAPPFRSASVEGSAGDSPEGLKGAPEPSDSLKGASDAPFKEVSEGLKGASRDSLPDSLKGAIGGFEGSVSGFEGSDPGFEGSAWALPHHVVPSRSSSSSTSTTSVAELPSNLPAVVTDAGGGGGSDLRSKERAEALVDALDFRGTSPSRSQRGKLIARVAAALEAGWNEGDLTAYLDLGDAEVRSPAAIYTHRLTDGELPDPQEYNAAPQGDMFDRAMARAHARMGLSTTDQRVQGALALGRQMQAEADGRPQTHNGGVIPRYRASGGHQPYSNGGWQDLHAAAANGAAPAGAEKYPHCGNCDPITRAHGADPCNRCHPALQF